MDCRALFSQPILEVLSISSFPSVPKEFKPITSLCQLTNTIAIGLNTCLIIAGVSDFAKSPESIIELEFTHEISSLCWDLDGRCLIVGDFANTLHFVSIEGAILCSYPVSSKALELQILNLEIFEEKNDASGKSLRSLLISFNNGQLVCIPKIPIGSICQLARTQPQALMAAVKNLSSSFLKCSLPLPMLSKIISVHNHSLRKSPVFGNENVIRYEENIEETSSAEITKPVKKSVHFSTLALDTNSRLYHVPLVCDFESSALTCDTSTRAQSIFEEGVNVSSVVVLPVEPSIMPGLAVALTNVDDGSIWPDTKIHLINIDLNDFKIVYTATLPGKFTTIASASYSGNDFDAGTKENSNPFACWSSTVILGSENAGALTLSFFGKYGGDILCTHDAPNNNAPLRAEPKNPLIDMAVLGFSFSSEQGKLIPLNSNGLGAGISVLTHY